MKREEKGQEFIVLNKEQRNVNKPRTPHSHFYTGSRIRIIMRNGDVIIARYKETRKGRLIETDRGEYRLSDIRTVNYYKPLPHERN